MMKNYDLISIKNRRGISSEVEELVKQRDKSYVLKGVDFTDSGLDNMTVFTLTRMIISQANSIWP